MISVIAAFAISPALSAPSQIPNFGLLSDVSSRRSPVTGSALFEQEPQQSKGQVLHDVFDLLDKKYVRNLDSQKLFDESLKTLLKGLDPHSVYMGPEEAKEFRLNLKDRFAGIGVILKTDSPSKYPEVAARFLNGPAARAGIQKGDQIVDIEGQSTHGVAPDAYFTKLRGEVGTSVRLSIRRPGDDRIRSLSIRRATIRVSSVRGLDLTENGFWLDKSSGIGYIRISGFREDTTRIFKTTYSRIKKDGLRALAIDLRSNPGGLLSAAVDIADIFVDSGIIVRSVGRDGKEKKWMARKGEDVSLPIVVLVNEETASASEILSACLQDHKRAVVVGIRSFGKGSIQQLFDVGKSGALVKLTTAHYFPASGRNIDKLNKPEGTDVWGISPDPGLEVPLEQAERETWSNGFFPRDNQVGTDLDMPPYDVSSDKVLEAARQALKRTLNLSTKG